MKKFTELLSVMLGHHESSKVFLPVLQDEKNSLEVTVNENEISIVGDNADVVLAPVDEKIKVSASNLVNSEILFANVDSALSFALYRLGIHLDPEDEEFIGTTPTGYPVLPKPACTFADHSARAYTKEQMLEFARDSVVRFTGHFPLEIEPTVYPYEEMYEDTPDEWCETCGGMVGDDCSCESEGEEEEEEGEEWEHADCEHCGCQSCDCDIDEDSICNVCHSASCQCLPDFNGSEDPEQKQVER